MDRLADKWTALLRGTAAASYKVQEALQCTAQGKTQFEDPRGYSD